MVHAQPRNWNIERLSCEATHHLLLIDKLHLLLLNLFIYWEFTNTNPHTHLQTTNRPRNLSLSLCLLCIPMQLHPTKNECYRTKKTLNHASIFPLKLNETNTIQKPNKFPKKCTIFSGVRLSKGFSLLFCSFYINR